MTNRLPQGRRARRVHVPLTIAAVLSGITATGAPASDHDAAAATTPEVGALLAQRAQAASVSSSRAAARAALAHPSTSSGPYAYIDPSRTPRLEPAQTTVVATDSRATAKLKVRLAAAARRMDATRRTYETASAAAGRASSDLLAATGEHLHPGGGARLGAMAGVPLASVSRGSARGDLQARAAVARGRELTAADAHRESIDAVLRLRSTVVAAMAEDAAARRAAEDAQIAAGTLVRLSDGTTAPAVPLGTPIPGNGWTMTPQVRGWITEALPVLYRAGMPRGREDMLALATIVYNESGGDPGVRNEWDANAAMGMPSFGLMQTIGPTFEAYAVPGHADPSAPADQIVAGARYALDRYGSLTNVPGVRSLSVGGPYLPY